MDITREDCKNRLVSPWELCYEQRVYNEAAWFVLRGI
jgi:hypothetical protein